MYESYQMIINWFIENSRELTSIFYSVLEMFYTDSSEFSVNYGPKAVFIGATKSNLKSLDSSSSSLTFCLISTSYGYFYTPILYDRSLLNLLCGLYLVKLTETVAEISSFF